MSSLPVTLTGTRLYDGTNDAAASILTIVTNYDGTNVTLTGSAVLAAADVGTNAISSVGTLALGGTAATNYTLIGANGSVIVTPGDILTITAQPQTITYGATVPASVITYGGFVDSQTNTSLTDQPSLASALSGVVGGGFYPSNYTASGAVDPDYTIVYVAGSLTVNPANQTISFPGLTNPTYGAAPYSISATASSGLPVSFTVVSGPVTVVGSNVTITGAGAVSIQASQAGNSNYNAAPPVTNSFTVNQASLTVTATGITKGYDGTTAAAVTLSDNRVNGDTFTDSYSSATFANAGPGTNIGVSVTGISISGPGATNYSLANTTASTQANITNVAPFITTQPADESVDDGGTATFSVVAGGTAPLNYHWKKDGVTIATATSSTLSLPGITDNSAGSYTVVVANVAGTITSSPGVLTVLNPPVITADGQPSSVVETNGGEAVFEVGVNGANLNYQWLSNGVPIAGQTESELDVDPVTISEAASYTVTITNTDGSVTSATALLTVVNQQISANPTIAVPVDTGTNLTLTVVTYGTDPSLTYQWSFNNTNLLGSTNVSYTVTNVQFASAGTYSVTVSDSAGSSASTMAVVTVTNPPPVVLTTNITVQLDPAGSVSITPAQVNNGSYANSGIASMSVVPNTFACSNVGPNIVTLSVTDNSNQVSSATATVTVQDTNPPVLSLQGITIQLDPTGNYTLTASDVASLTAGTTDPCGFASTNVTPNTFTYCDAPSKTVTVVVTDVYGNSATNTTTVNITLPPGPPPVTYVDPNYTSGPCPSVTFPYTGGSGAYYIGYNAFPTIQQGLNKVTNGGIVLVAPGTYNESPQINQSVTLQSVGGNSAASTFIVLLPSAMGPPNNYQNSAMAINASDVSVKGFTMVGYDAPVDQSGPSQGQASVNIYINAFNPAPPAVTNIEIANNVIEVGAIGQFTTYSDGFGIETVIPAFLQYGSGQEFGGEWPPGTSPTGALDQNINIHNNIFEPVDVPPAYDTDGMAFFINPAGNFSFVSNTITGDMEQSTTSAANSYIAYNTVTGTTTNDTSGAFATFGWPDPDDYGHATFLGNVINNIASGIAVYDSENVTIENNQLAGNGVGISVQDSGYDPVYPGGTTVHILDNNFAGDSIGVDDISSNGTAIAESNWWGDISGPYSLALNPYGVGSAITTNVSPTTTNVLITPWLGSGVNTEPSVPGFYPNSTPVEYPPVQLVFSTEPQGANLNSPLTVQPVIQIEDTNGNVTPWANPAVTMTLSNDRTGADLSGVTPETAANGIATFVNLSVTNAGGSNLTLVASAPYLTPTNSTAFNITNPAPVISGIDPFFVPADVGGFTIIVTGSSFVNGSVVYWNGMPLATTYVSPTELTAMVPGSYVTSTGSALITVGNPGPGGGLTGSLAFSIDPTKPPVTYVDTNYATLTNNTLVNWPYNGSPGPHIIGYDAFATIQDGADNVASTGTVNVAAGVFVEDLNIPQALTLLGPNSNINPNTGVRVPEAIIEPATSDPNPYDASSEIVVYVQTNLVTIEGFTVDGSNPGLSGGVLVNGVEVNAAEGIVSYEGVGSITVANNIVKDTAYTGVDFYNNVNPAGTANNYIVSNRFDNLGAYGFGIGVLMYNNFYAQVSDNVMTNLVVGVQTGNFNLASPGMPQIIENNLISANAVGIFYNLMYQASSAFVVSNNTISFAYAAGSPFWDGMLITSLQDGVGAYFVNNNITCTTTNEEVIGYPTVGYDVWNTPTTGQVLIAGGAVNNANYGVWVNDYEGYAFPADKTTATVAGVAITGSSIAGVYVQDDPLATPHTPVQVTVTSNTVVTGSGLGVWVQGTNAGASIVGNSSSITGNGVGVQVDTGVALLQGNDLTGNTTAGILTTNGAIVDAGNCSGVSVIRLGISTGGNNLSGYSFNNVAPFAIANYNPTSNSVVLAEDDNFGAMVGTNIASDIYDPVGGVAYSQNPLLVSSPPTIMEQCVSQVISPANSLASFLSQGGTVTANSPSVTVTSQDVPTLTQELTTIRTYTISDGCTSNTCQQTIILHETNPPTIGMCPANFVLSGSNIDYTLPTATDICGAGTVVVTGNPAPGSGPYPPGVYTVVCTAQNDAGLTNSCSFQVVVPNTTLTNAFVDASYASLSPGTSVNWPNNGNPGPHSIGLDAFATVQGGVNAVEAGGTVQVAAGSYTENVTANKPVILQGANVGVGGCASRGPESIINGGAGNAISITSSNVVVDGFELNGLESVVDSGFVGAVIQNNSMNAVALGVDVRNIVTAAGAGFTLQSNCVTLVSQLAGSTPTIGISFNGVAGAQPPLILSNNVSGAFYGYLLYGLNASASTVVQGGAVTGAMQGVSVFNINPLTLSAYGSSTFGVSGVTVTGFAGSYPSLEAAGNDFHAGVYVFTSGPLTTAVVTGAVSNVTVSGSGSISPDSSGLYFTDFSTAAGLRQQITVQNCNISFNENRGIFISGSNAVASVGGSAVLSNGFNPYGTGGNDGFGIIARNNAQVTISNCFIANPATVTAPYTVRAVEADANTLPFGPTVVVTDCSIVNNGNPNGYLASQDAGTLNASGNWWGATNDAAIAGLMLGVVDFTPYLDSGTDTDLLAPGFQGDFSALHVTTLGAQTGGTGRIQEGIDSIADGSLTGGSRLVYVQPGTYSEMNNPQDCDFLIDRPVTVMSTAGPASTTINGVKQYMVLIYSGNATVSGLNITDPTYSTGGFGGDGSGVWLGGTGVSNVHITNCTIHDLGERVFGVNAGPDGSVEVAGCTIYNVHGYPSSEEMSYILGGPGDFGDAALGILVYGWSAATDGISVHGNTIYSLDSRMYSAGMDIGGAHNADIRLNQVTLAGSVPDGILIDNSMQSGAATVASNTVSGSESGIELDSTFGQSATYNAISGATSASIYVNGSAATLKGNSASVGSQIGIWVTGAAGKALIESNTLVGDSVAGIKADIGAIVDAGDCTGSDVTGLATGSGLNGSSAGGNNLSGYGFDNVAPWAIQNLNGASPAVLGYENSYGAVVGNNLASVFSGTVLADQSGGLLVQYPAALDFECLSSVPSGATSLAAFVAQGGAVSATVANVSFNDSVVSNTPNNRVITRAYSLSDACSQTASGTQIITVVDTIPPMVTTWPAPETLNVQGQCNIPVPDLTTNVIGASDNCGTVVITQSPVAGTLVSLGTTNITVIVSDLGGNSISNVVTLTIVDTNPSPTATYVDASYTGLPAGTVVTWPYSVGSGTHYIGCDAFPTIQQGVNRVASNGTVNVAAGQYVEDLTITNALSLLGPNSAINPNTGTRVAEAVILPSVNNPRGDRL